MGSNISRRDALKLTGGAAAFAVSSLVLSRFGGLFDTNVAYAAYPTPSGDFTGVTQSKNWAYPPNHYTTASGWVIDWLTRFYATFSDGVKGNAYCVNPGIAYEATISTSVSALDVLGDPLPSGRRLADARTFLWFALGGPGYERSMWPASYKGEELTDRTIYWCCHYLATEIIWGNTRPLRCERSLGFLTSPEMADTGFDLDLIPWLQSAIWGSGSDSVLYKMIHRANEVPDAFETYVINKYNFGTQPNTQMLIGSVPMSKGSLTVKKITTGLKSSDSFQFQVEFSGSGAPATVRFSLKNGEQHRIDNIPYGVTYTVTELNATGYKSDWSKRTGTISKNNNDAVCTCTNSSGSLTVKKIVNGAASGLKFKFKVTFTGTDKPEDKTFELAHGGSYTIKPIPFGVSYSVTEIDTKGYAVTWSGDRTGTINASHYECACTATNSSGALQLEKDVTE